MARMPIPASRKPPKPRRKPSKASLRKKADAMFSAQVRARGICQARGFDGIACSGTLQTMHLVPRRYLSVRWDPSNAACGCSAHHVYLTHFPLAHERFCKALLGSEGFEALKARAEEADGPPDYEAVLERLGEGA